MLPGSWRACPGGPGFRPGLSAVERGHFEAPGRQSERPEGLGPTDETGISTPSLDDITIPAGTYTDVYLGIELRDEDSQPSVIMEGTYTHSNSTVIPIRFEFNSGEVFEAETSQQVVVNENETALSKIVFDPQVWFSVVSTNALDNASLTDGVIIISETKNEAIFDLVADRLDVSTESTFQ